MNKFNQLFLIAALAAACTGNADGQTSTKKDYSWNNLPVIVKPVFKKDTFNIIAYGAKRDGITLHTKIINDAINACSSKGGGVVLIPKGLWITGPVVLKSNVNLHISHGALLQFSPDKNLYPLVAGNYEGHPSPRNQSPISGTDLVNIAITGEGIIDGRGEVWRAMGKDRVTEREWNKLVASGGVIGNNGKSWYPSAGFLKGATDKSAIMLEPGKPMEAYAEMKDFYRPNMLVLTNCKKVLLENTTFQNSPAWCLHTLLCEDLTLTGVRVRNESNAQNGDALDLESCRNVLVENCTFDAGDDGICIKSGRDEAGRQRGVPTENVIVRNNIVYKAHGGFVIGSEMSGGARNIFVSDCTFIGTDIGLRFKTTRGRGGIVEKIYIKDITMRDILHSAILFDMYYGGKSAAEDPNAKQQDVIKNPVNEGTPQFREFYVNNVVCNGAETGLLIRGLPEMSIKGIHLENLVLKSVKGVEISEAANVTLKNVRLVNTDTRPVVMIDNSSNVQLDGIQYTEGADQLFTITGNRTKQISILNTDASKAKNKVEYKSGADSKAVVFK
jgi:polygalacturonase